MELGVLTQGDAVRCQGPVVGHGVVVRHRTEPRPGERSRAQVFGNHLGGTHIRGVALHVAHEAVHLEHARLIPRGKLHIAGGRVVVVIIPVQRGGCVPGLEVRVVPVPLAVVLERPAAGMADRASAGGVLEKADVQVVIVIVLLFRQLAIRGRSPLADHAGG